MLDSQDPALPTVPLEAHPITAATPTAFATSLRLLRDVLDGRRSLLPLADAGSTPDAHRNALLTRVMRVGEPIAPGTLLACTSGSTGTPKGAQLNAGTISAAATATAAVARQRFGVDPGLWLLSVPAHHIAGLQVILRNLVAHTAPDLTSLCPVARRCLTSSFTAAHFAADVDDAFAHADTHHPTSPTLSISLVPAQVEKLLHDPDPIGLRTLTRFAVVLVGGAATRPEVAARLRDSGVNLLTTYGSSETNGGVVYDGFPLPGMSARILDPDATGAGVIELSGPMVAAGYRNPLPDDPFTLPATPNPTTPTSTATPTSRSYRTSDLGRLNPDGSLTVLGRADGAINTGGYKVLPEDCERALLDHLPLTAACATAFDLPGFGTAIAALVELAPHSPLADAAPAPSTTDLVDITDITDITDTVRQRLRGQVSTPLIPRRVWAITSMPTTGPGKVDRQEVARLVANHTVDHTASPTEH